MLLRFEGSMWPHGRPSMSIGPRTKPWDVCQAARAPKAEREPGSRCAPRTLPAARAPHAPPRAGLLLAAHDARVGRGEQVAQRRCARVRAGRAGGPSKLFRPQHPTPQTERGSHVAARAASALRARRLPRRHSQPLKGAGGAARAARASRDAGAHGRMKGRRHRAPRLAAHPPAAPAGARTRRGRRKAGTQQAGT